MSCRRLETQTTLTCYYLTFTNMNYKKLIKLGTLAGFISATMVQANWIRLTDFEEYPLTEDEDEIAEFGWIFQDFDFNGFPQCVDGSRDCTGVRDIVMAPFEGGLGKSILIRGSNPDEVDPSNARSVTVFEMAEEIPLGGTATVYMRFAAGSRQVSFHWGLTGRSYPGGPSNAENFNYTDLAVTSQVAFEERETLSIYDGWWTESTLDPEKVLDTEIWYELWYHITNETQALGGGYFDVYIRGGAWEEVTHLANPHQAAYDDWLFRDNADLPLNKILWIVNSGNPNVGPIRSGAMYFDDFYIKLGEFSTEQPPLRDEDENGNGEPVPVVSLWEDVAVETGTEWKNTAMGWIHDANYPWILFGTSTWVYVAHEQSSLEDGVYMFDVAGDNWIWASNHTGGWHYSFAGDGEWSH